MNNWICTLGVTILLFISINLASAACPATPPTGIRPACPGLTLTQVNTRSACQSANSSCCWDGTARPQLPKCYYVPDLQQIVYNVALGKQTYSSSNEAGKYPWKAVDGCYQDYSNVNCCFHSSVENNAWWSVDLRNVMPVVSVTIIADTNQAMEVNLFISNVTNSPNSASDLMSCSLNPITFISRETKKLTCKPYLNARYVMIQLTPNSIQKYLSLCDVQVETAGLINTAYGKIAWQSSTLEYSNIDGNAYKSVDGSLSNQYWNSQCSHTHTNSTSANRPNDTNPWWSVDLGQIFTIYSLTIVNRGDGERRLKNLTLSVSNSSHSPTDTICATYRGNITLGKAQNIACVKEVNARFVIIQKHNDHELNMCEVIVETVCPEGKYGSNCWKNCHYCRNNATCNNINGHCPNGQCAEGYDGDKCDTKCADGKYGENCAYNCSQFCKNKAICERTNGHCPQGECMAGYWGERCDLSCPAGKYGVDCQHSCFPHCKGHCDITNGACTVGCEDGWMGKFCDIVCPEGKYGSNCWKNCHYCRTNATCNKVNGHCPNGMCAEGYDGNKCDTKCADGKYGENCAYNCSQFCKNRAICERTNGHCPQGECMAGYWGERCDLSCPADKYGTDCQHNCFPHCTGPCVITNGACAVGCEEGWTGKFCDIEKVPPSNLTEIIVPVIGVVVIVISILIAMYFYMKLKQKSRSAKRLMYEMKTSTEREHVGDEKSIKKDEKSNTNNLVHDNENGYVKVRNITLGDGSSGNPSEMYYNVPERTQRNSDIMYDDINEGASVNNVDDVTYEQLNNHI